MSAGSVVQVIGTPGNSPALKYELQLTEATITGNIRTITTERVHLCLSVLDDVIPKLGVYQRVMILLKNELYNAIFSDEYTAEGNKLKKISKFHSNDNATPTRLPYFTIAKRCMEEKEKEVTKLKRNISTLREQLYTCEADLEKASSVVDGLKHDLKECDSRINELTSDLHTTTKNNDCLLIKTSDLQQQYDNMKLKLEEQILQYKNSIASQEVSINELKTYKTTHDKIQKAFSSVKGNDSVSYSGQTASIKATLQSEINIAKTMETQLLQIQNIQIDEYEKGLDNWSRKDVDRNKLKMNKEKFKIVINEIDTELSQLRSHIVSLEYRLEQLSTIDPAHPHKAIITSDHPYCPLVTQEQLLNKYAAMLHTSSDNGVKYYPIKEADMCQSCGEKVVVCSHWSLSELIIQLPLNSTHIKMTRPQLYSHAPPTLIESNDQMISLTIEKESSLSIWTPDISKIWSHFNSQYTSIPRGIPRSLSKEFLLMIMSKFYSHVLAQDKTSPTNSTHSSNTLLTSFYQFIIKRYYLKPIGLLIIRDLITTLEQYVTDNIYLLVFGHILAGSLDGVVFRYQLLYSDLVNIIDWSTDDELFNKWSNIVYEHLEDDVLEQLPIDYIGHSNNITSSITVMNYLTHQFMKFRDPLIKEAESMLSDQNTTRPGSMNETEFAETCLLLCPSYDGLAMALYSQTIANKETTDNYVSIRQLSYILGYVLLINRFDTITNQLKEQFIINNNTDTDQLITLSALQNNNN